MSYCAVYLNRIHREKNLPEKPEDPLILEKSIPSDGEFTFIDIVPSVLTYSSTAHEVEYHRFSHLIETANKWLEKNTQWNIVNCETVRLSYRHNVTSMVSRWEQQINPVTPLWSPISRGEFETSLKALRLWIRRKDQFDNEFTLNDDIMFNDKYRILKYLDFIPKRLNENSFETIDQVLERINARLKQPDTLFWNIITLESLKIEANSEWEIDTELCLFDESSRHLTILRLFYEEYNSPNDMINYDFNSNDDYPYTMIGIEDFTPNLISAGSFFKRPIFEPFCTLTQRASRWLNSECVDYFLNAQSIDVKLKSASRIETRNCTNIEQGNFIQFLRIVYCKLFSRNDSNNNPNTIQKLKPYDTITSMNQEFFNQLSDTMQLCSKVFVATKLDHPLDSMQQRIYNWLHLVNNYNNNKNLCILGAETITIYGKDDDEKLLEKKTSECFHGNRFGSLNCFQFKAIRLYYCQLPINNFENDNDNIFNIGDNGSTNKSIKNYYYRTGSTKTFQKKKIQTNNQINSSDISKDKGLQRRNSKLKLSRSNSYRLMLKNNDYNDPNPTVSNDNNNQVKTMVDGRKFGFFKKNFSKKHLKRSQSNNNYNKIRDNSHNQSLTYCNCM